MASGPAGQTSRLVSDRASCGRADVLTGPRRRPRITSIESVAVAEQDKTESVPAKGEVPSLDVEGSGVQPRSHRAYAGLSGGWSASHPGSDHAGRSSCGVHHRSSSPACACHRECPPVNPWRPTGTATGSLASPGARVPRSTSYTVGVGSAPLGDFHQAPAPGGASGHRLRPPQPQRVRARRAGADAPRSSSAPTRWPR